MKEAWYEYSECETCRFYRKNYLDCTLQHKVKKPNTKKCKDYKFDEELGDYAKRCD